MTERARGSSMNQIATIAIAAIKSATMMFK
jgi:hypothetical protein